jgi:hypothetical protein
MTHTTKIVFALFLLSNFASATESRMTVKEGLKEGKRMFSEIEKAEATLYSLLKKGKHTEIEKKIETPMYNLQQAWRDDYAMWPFTKCDTASRDLNILAGAYKMRLSEQIIQAEFNDFRRSKSACADSIRKPTTQLEKEIAKEKLEVECAQKQTFDASSGKLSLDPAWRKPKFCP